MSRWPRACMMVLWLDSFPLQVVAFIFLASAATIQRYIMTDG